jgi:hypothetical protein
LLCRLARHPYGQALLGNQAAHASNKHLADSEGVLRIIGALPLSKGAPITSELYVRFSRPYL